MSLPADLPGQVAHVFMSSPQRDVLLNMAKAIEALQPKVAVPSEYRALAEKTSPWGVPIQEGDDVSTDSES